MCTSARPTVRTTAAAHTPQISVSQTGPCDTGRFETNTKICLSYTSFHPEEWQPAWGVRTMLDALTGIFPVRHVAVIPQERHQAAVCIHIYLTYLAPRVPCVDTDDFAGIHCAAAGSTWRGRLDVQ